MERKNLGAKPFCYPQPVFIIAAYGEGDVPNVMNAAWGGTSDYKEMTLCLSKGHKTVANLRERGAFTISMGTADQMVACDYVGVVSGNKVPDKFARAGWHATRSAYVDAPLIDELPLALECKLISYDEETGQRSSTSRLPSPSSTPTARSIPPSCAPSPSIRSTTSTSSWARP